MARGWFEQSGGRLLRPARETIRRSSCSAQPRAKRWDQAVFRLGRTCGAMSDGSRHRLLVAFFLCRLLGRLLAAASWPGFLAAASWPQASWLLAFVVFLAAGFFAAGFFAVVSSLPFEFSLERLYGSPASTQNIVTNIESLKCHTFPFFGSNWRFGRPTSRQESKSAVAE